MRAQNGRDLVDLFAGVRDGVDDLQHGFLQIFDIALLARDDFLPVPLVDIDGVEVVQHLFVAADGVHVGIKPVPGVKIIAIQRHALPFGERMHDLRLGARGGDGEADGSLDARMVVV